MLTFATAWIYAFNAALEEPLGEFCVRGAHMSPEGQVDFRPIIHLVFRTSLTLEGSGGSWNAARFPEGPV